MSDVTLLTAFVAGILSFLSPCVLPMVPVYLANIAGASVLRQDAKVGYKTPLFHTLAFVAGFTTVFVSMGAAAGLFGFYIGAHVNVLNKIAGGLLIIFGLFLLATLMIPRLNYEKNISGTFGSGSSHLRSYLVGAAFSLGWTPCVGPILGGILTLAYNSETAWEGAFLLTIYSIGLGVPFVVMSFAVARISSYMKRFSRYTPIVSIVSGLLLIVLGSLLFFDRLRWPGF